jgi:hypothetical protein
LALNCLLPSLSPRTLDCTVSIGMCCGFEICSLFLVYYTLLKIIKVTHL